MNYYVETHYYDHDKLNSSAAKGRDDYFEMMRRTGLRCIKIPVFKRRQSISWADRIRLEMQIPAAWKAALKGLGKGDTLFVPNPPSERFLMMPRILRAVQRRGCRIAAVVFDLEEFMTPYHRKSARLKDYFSRRTERRLFEMADAMVVHNRRMKEKIVQSGIRADSITAGTVMDYLSDSEADAQAIALRRGADRPVVFCGNLLPEKAGFLREIPAELKMDVYGPGYTAPYQANITYRGVYSPEEIMDVLDGSFGLVWDGDSAHTGAGIYGEYLRCNSPHKMALYLASGMPVIVWDESAMADFVRDEGCGIALSSLDDLPQILAQMTDEEYEQMLSNALRIGGQMRRGEHLQRAFEAALEKLGEPETTEAPETTGTSEEHR